MSLTKFIGRNVRGTFEPKSGVKPILGLIPDVGSNFWIVKNVWIVFVIIIKIPLCSLECGYIPSI